MRSLARHRQKVWFTSVTEVKSGIDTVVSYSTPVMRKLAVSYTSGTPEEVTAGILPTYDRYITSYTRGFKPAEGDRVFVDRMPELNPDGSLKLQSDGYTPVVSPDYVIAKIISTESGNVSRFGIKRIDINNG